MGASEAKKAGRAMSSLVHWALLGLVIERPSYGMELYRRYERAYADVLPISESSHIYTGLNELQRREFVEEFLAGASGRQPRPHYRATRSGLRSYVEWLVEQARIEQNRQALWVRQLGAFSHHPAAALHVIERFERGYLKEVERGSLARKRGSVSDDPVYRLIDGLVAERRRLVDGAMVTWFQHAHDAFEALTVERAETDAAP